MPSKKGGKPKSKSGGKSSKADQAPKSASGSPFTFGLIAFSIWLVVTAYLFTASRRQLDAARQSLQTWESGQSTNVLGSFVNPEKLAIVRESNHSSLLFASSFRSPFFGIEGNDGHALRVMRVRGKSARGDFGKVHEIWRARNTTDKESAADAVPELGDRSCREPVGLKYLSLHGMQVKVLQDGKVRLAVVLHHEERESVELFDITMKGSDTNDEKESPVQVKWVGCVFTPTGVEGLNDVDFDSVDGRYLFASEAMSAPYANKVAMVRELVSPTPGRIWMYDLREEKIVPKVVDNTGHAKGAFGVLLLEGEREWNLYWSEGLGKQVCRLTLDAPNRGSDIMAGVDVYPSRERKCVDVGFIPDNLTFDGRRIHVAGPSGYTLNLLECTLLSFSRWQPYCRAPWIRVEMDPESLEILHKGDEDAADRIGFVSTVVRDPYSECLFLGSVLSERIGHVCH